MSFSQKQQHRHFTEHVDLKYLIWYLGKQVETVSKTRHLNDNLVFVKTK